MKTITLRTILFALIAALALAGCKSESSSPTAPPTTSTQTPPSGGVAPPTNASINLTVSNANPLVSSIVTVTATVTVNGQPVPDGTAVQFTTSLGTFKDTAQNVTIRTTTNGVATAQLTSAAAGPANVSATVNNVTKSTTVTFGTQPVTPLPPNTTPTITSVCVESGAACVTPATGLPAGGAIVDIVGTNFRAPVRVLFDPGNGQASKEGFVQSVTPTLIKVVTPPFDVTTGQTLAVTVTVINEAGTTNEVKVSAANAFTYQVALLTPTFRALNPTSGPIDGGTRVTIFGDGFQAPVQVFFGAAEAQVLNVQFSQIIVVTPNARDTSPNGGTTVTGPVDITIINVASGKSTVAKSSFRYIAKMQITSVNPTSGPAVGGTDITIDGVGFNDPVTVDIGTPGVRAQVLRVSGTEILARTTGLASPCSTAGTGLPITVTNVDNGDSATSIAPQVFTYIPVVAAITSITPSVTPPQPGNTLSVAVQNPGVGPLGSAFISFSIGTQGATVTPSSITNGTGTQSFTVVVPNTLTFPGSTTQPAGAACTLSGVPGFLEFGNASFPVTFTNTTTGCTATAGPITFAPLASANPCIVPPPPAASVTNPTSGCANAGSVVAAGTATGTTTITIANTGGQALTIAANPAIGGTNPGDFSITPTTGKTVNPASSTSYTITFDPQATGARSATVTFTTNDPLNPTITVCLSGTGT